ncbi:MAG TPA: type II toxin-antitoxin system PemK/MazF family toxin [Streptosporangiaceae bacterium]|nr:type II toxin-antitoxin system PemK/MazF family toxin [Streptosporangiaceae bacterium]
MQPDDGPGSAAFAEVWLADLGAGPEPRLIVSGRRYASGRPDMVLTAVIDAPPQHPSYAAPASGFLGEEVPGVGRAQLDIITTVYRHRLTERVTTLPEQRHASIAGRVRDLIGP